MKRDRGNSLSGETRPTDEELMERMAAGEAAALETVYDRYSGIVYGLALRILGDRDPSYDREDPAAEPEGDGLVAAELRQEVGNALDGLPGEQRAVLEMAYYEGYSQREISEKTGLPLGTVKTRTRLALRKLREVLDPTLRNRVEGPDGVR